VPGKEWKAGETEKYAPSERMDLGPGLQTAEEYRRLLAAQGAIQRRAQRAGSPIDIEQATHTYLSSRAESYRLSARDADDAYEFVLGLHRYLTVLAEMHKRGVFPEGMAIQDVASARTVFERYQRLGHPEEDRALLDKFIEGQAMYKTAGLKELAEQRPSEEFEKEVLRVAAMQARPSDAPFGFKIKPTGAMEEEWERWFKDQGWKKMPGKVSRPGTAEQAKGMETVMRARGMRPSGESEGEDAIAWTNQMTTALNKATGSTSVSVD